MDECSMEFRGTRSGVLLKARVGSDLPLFLDRLRQRLEGSKGFFSGSSVRVQFEDGEVSAEAVLRISSVLSECGLQLCSISTGADQRAYGDHGLGTLASSSVVAEDGNSILVKRTLRSGQRVDFGGNVIVLGDVNPGAEIVAGGDIVVMGSLRGVAHAGAYGDDNAVVVAFRLSPTQLRIADRISRSPDAALVNAGFPEVARISTGAIVIETFSVPTSGR